MIHLQIIDASGGSHGVRSRGRLESVVASQTQEVFGKELYRSMYDKAGAVARGIIAYHPFIDGNKRTGMMSALVFLERNSIQTELTNQELEDFAVQVATDKLDVPVIARWLAAHSKKEG